MQLALFDLELQQPAASTKLSASRPAFTAILGSCGHDGAEHRPTDGGVDLVYCLHQVCMFKMLRMQCTRGFQPANEQLCTAVMLRVALP